MIASIEERERPVVIVPVPVEAPPVTTEAARFEYISQVRLNELRALRPAAFDLRKLIRFCEEIDSSFRAQNFLAVAALTRAVLDHIPPVFAMSSFNEVANNYGGGGHGGFSPPYSAPCRSRLSGSCCINDLAPAA